MPKLQEFSLDASIIAKEIYRCKPHQTTPIGVVLEENIRQGLSDFLQRFLTFTGCSADSFFRVDAFIRGDALEIVEINVECQEGWGISLNLLRASRNALGERRILLPQEIIAYGEEYMPEFQLVQAESKLLGIEMDIVRSVDRPGVPIRSRFDNKMYLARFERRIAMNENCCIRVPPMYCADTTAWEEIPDDVVFKFCVKYGEWSQKARYSVATRAEIGKGKFMRKCYEAYGAVAQKRIQPFHTKDGSVTQAIIMCAGILPVTGYLQIAPPDTFVINDRSARKGPLIFTR